MLPITYTDELDPNMERTNKFFTTMEAEVKGWDAVKLA